MAFTNFCCRSGGSNLNAGTRTGDTTVPGTGYDRTVTAGTWVQSTRTFTRLDAGNFTTDGYTTNDFVSIYPDAATVSPYIAKLTTVTATTLITSSTLKAGTAPVDGTANTSVRLGGAWKGPNAAENFPFNFVAQTLTNAAANAPRVNFMNDAQYDVTAAITHSLAGPAVWAGFNAAYGDSGRATIDGGTSGASYALLTFSGATHDISNLILANNGSTGSASGVVFSGSRCLLRNSVIHDHAGFGLVTVASTNVEEVELYLCNKSNTSALGAVSLVGGRLARCTIHDNTAGSNCHGIVSSGASLLSVIEGCIFDTNAGNGINLTAAGVIQINRSDFYNNSVNGILIANAAVNASIVNCNFVKNTTAGVNVTTVTSQLGVIQNCGFGVGTQANGTNLINTGQMFESGSVNYGTGLTPWVDPANGDFRINLATAKGVGRGSFTETASSYAGTVGYPDIGASQHREGPRPRFILGV